MNLNQILELDLNPHQKVAPLIFLLEIDLAFNFVKISIGISISLSSTCHTSSADKLLNSLEYAVV